MRKTQFEKFWNFSKHHFELTLIVADLFASPKIYDHFFQSMQACERVLKQRPIHIKVWKMELMTS